VDGEILFACLYFTTPHPHCSGNFLLDILTFTTSVKPITWPSAASFVRFLLPPLYKPITREYFAQFLADISNVVRIFIHTFHVYLITSRKEYLT